MLINPFVFTLLVSGLILCSLVLIGLFGRHLWLKKVDAAAMDTILTSLDAMANTRHQVIANALRPFYRQDETALKEQAEALVGYELAMQRNCLEAFAAHRISGLAAMPGWAETMVTPYHAIIQRLAGDATAPSSRGPAADEQIDALRMALQSDIACLKGDLRDENARLLEELSANRSRIEALEATLAGGGQLETAEEAMTEDAEADAGVVFDNVEPAASDNETAMPAAEEVILDAPSPADEVPVEAPVMAEDSTMPEEADSPEETTAAASDGDDLLVVDEEGGVEQDDLAAAWADALEEAGSDDIDIDAMLEGQTPDGVRQSA